MNATPDASAGTSACTTTAIAASHRRRRESAGTRLHGRRASDAQHVPTGVDEPVDCRERLGPWRAGPRTMPPPRPRRWRTIARRQARRRSSALSANVRGLDFCAECRPGQPSPLRAARIGLCRDRRSPAAPAGRRGSAGPSDAPLPPDQRRVLRSVLKRSFTSIRAYALGIVASVAHLRTEQIILGKSPFRRY